MISSSSREQTNECAQTQTALLCPHSVHSAPPWTLFCLSSSGTTTLDPLVSYLLVIRGGCLFQGQAFSSSKLTPRPSPFLVPLSFTRPGDRCGPRPRRDAPTPQRLFSSSWSPWRCWVPALSSSHLGISTHAYFSTKPKRCTIFLSNTHNTELIREMNNHHHQT